MFLQWSLAVFQPHDFAMVGDHQFFIFFPGTFPVKLKFLLGHLQLLLYVFGYQVRTLEKHDHKDGQDRQSQDDKPHDRAVQGFVHLDSYEG